MTEERREDWWFRFNLGLPPRAVDLIELGRIAPELFSRSGPSIVELPPRPVDLIRRSAPVLLLRGGPSIYWDVSHWVCSVSEEEIERYRQSGRQICKYPECLVTEPGRGEERQRPEESSPDSGDSSEPFFPQLMVLGGIKKPLDQFLDCVRRVHARKKPIKKIVLTDPYIFIAKASMAPPGASITFSSMSPP
jgi:hypothetical protein